MGEGFMPRFGPGWVRPSFCEILLFTCGVCSFGFGFAECRFLLLLLLNIMLQPCIVHLCISRKCTALKWIFKAPLSQNVFMHTLHWTRFFPVVGLTKEMPRSSGKLVRLLISTSMELLLLPESLSISSLSSRICFSDSFPVKLSALEFGGSLCWLRPFGRPFGRPGKGNIGKWFDMRLDMDMEEGGKGIPLARLRGKMGAAGWLFWGAGEEGASLAGGGGEGLRRGGELIFGGETSRGGGDIRSSFFGGCC